MHLRHQLRRTGEPRVVLKVLGLPYGTRVVAVQGHRKIGERQQVDAVALFERLYVRVPYADTQYGG